MYTGSLPSEATEADLDIAQRLKIVSRDFARDAHDAQQPIPKKLNDAPVVELNSRGAATVGGEKQLKTDIYRLLLNDIGTNALVLLSADAAGCATKGHRFEVSRHHYGSTNTCCDRCDSEFPPTAPVYHCTSCNSADLCFTCFAENPTMDRPGVSFSAGAHLPLLVARSGYVAAMVQGGFADSCAGSDGKHRVVLSDEVMDLPALRALLTAMYTDELSLCSDEAADQTEAEQIQLALQVWQCAKYLDVKSAVHVTESYVVGKIDTEFAVDILRWAKTVECDYVRRRCMQFLRQHFGELASSASLLGLELEDMEELLSSSLLEATEVDVVHAVLRWAKDPGAGKCDNCDAPEPQPPTVTCLSCAGNLCADCDTAIHTFKLLANHVRTPFSPDTEAALPDPDRLQALVPHIRLAYVPADEPALETLLELGAVSPAAVAAARRFQAPSMVQLCAKCHKSSSTYGASRIAPCRGCGVTFCLPCLRKEASLEQHHEAGCKEAKTYRKEREKKRSELLSEAIQTGDSKLLPRFGERCMAVVRKKAASIERERRLTEALYRERDFRVSPIHRGGMMMRMMAPMNGRDGYDIYRVPDWLQAKFDTGAASVPTAAVMKSVLRREKELRLSVRAQSANAHPATDDLALTHQLQLQAVREHGLDDAMVHVLRAAYATYHGNGNGGQAAESRSNCNRDGNNACPQSGSTEAADVVSIPHYRKFNRCKQGGMVVGDCIPDLQLHRLDGTKVFLSGFQSTGRPLVLFAGSYT